MLRPRYARSSAPLDLVDRLIALWHRSTPNDPGRGESDRRPWARLRTTDRRRRRSGFPRDRQTGRSTSVVGTNDAPWKTRAMRRCAAVLAGLLAVAGAACSTGTVAPDSTGTTIPVAPHAGLQPVAEADSWFEAINAETMRPCSLTSTLPSAPTTPTWSSGAPLRMSNVAPNHLCHRRPGKPAARPHSFIAPSSHTATRLRPMTLSGPSSSTETPTEFGSLRTTASPKSRVDRGQKDARARRSPGGGTGASYFPFDGAVADSHRGPALSNARLGSLAPLHRQLDVSGGVF